MYQPLKGQPGNSRPPISISMLETAGRPYHFRSRSLNHSYLVRGNRGIAAVSDNSIHYSPDRGQVNIQHLHYEQSHVKIICGYLFQNRYLSQRYTSLTRSAAKININTKKPLLSGIQCWTEQAWLQSTTHHSLLHPLGGFITLLSVYYLQSWV